MNILIVDNDKNTVETLKAALTAEKDYEIDIAYGGKEALKKMKGDKLYHILILDIMMPEVNGMDICQSMVQDKKLKKIPVLLISALPISSKAFQDSLEKFNELGIIKNVLEKPFSIEDLLIKVKTIINK